MAVGKEGERVRFDADLDQLIVNTIGALYRWQELQREVHPWSVDGWLLIEQWQHKRVELGLAERVPGRAEAGK